MARRMYGESSGVTEMIRCKMFEKGTAHYIEDFCNNNSVVKVIDYEIHGQITIMIFYKV